MRILLFLILLVLPLAAKDSPEEILGRLPDEIAGCTKGKYHQYEPAVLGGSVSYRLPGFLVTVYVYDLGKDKISDDLDDAVLQDTFKQAQGDIRSAAERGLYSDVTELNAEDMRSAFGTLCARYRLQRTEGPDKGVPLFSEIHVFGARGHIIKFRVSGEIEKEKDSRKVLDRLLPEIRRTLLQPKSSGKPR